MNDLITHDDHYFSYLTYPMSSLIFSILPISTVRFLLISASKDRQESNRG
jgi:hypothetical protein